LIQPAIRSLLSQSLETAVLGSNGVDDGAEGPGSEAGDYSDRLTIRNNDKSVIEVVRRIREHPLAPGRIPIHGLADQVETGLLVEVDDASALGAPR